jgi:hypothetical protein
MWSHGLLFCKDDEFAEWQIGICFGCGAKMSDKCGRRSGMSTPCGTTNVIWHNNGLSAFFISGRLQSAIWLGRVLIDQKSFWVNFGGGTGD